MLTGNLEVSFQIFLCSGGWLQLLGHMCRLKHNWGRRGIFSD